MKSCIFLIFSVLARKNIMFSPVKYIPYHIYAHRYVVMLTKSVISMTKSVVWMTKNVV